MIRHQVAGQPKVVVRFDGKAEVTIPIQPRMEPTFIDLATSWPYRTTAVTGINVIGDDKIVLVVDGARVDEALGWFVKPDAPDRGALASMNNHHNDRLEEVARQQTEGEQVAADWHRRLKGV